MSKLSRYPLLTGTILLTLAGFASRIIGFFYRIFLSRTIGAEGVGIYQLVFPIYGLCFSLVVSGMQSGISRYCAKSFASGNSNKSRVYFSSGLLFSFCSSVIVSVFLFRYASLISTNLLNDSRCTKLLQLLAFSLPLGTIHTCINAWYYAQKQTGIPSLSQLLEQIARVGSTFLIYLIFLEKGLTPTPVLAAAGVLIGEIVSSLFSALCILLQFQNKIYRNAKGYSFLSCTKELVFLSFPLTANRVSLSLLQSMEAIMIPGRLVRYGLSSSNALSTYGTLTGMALPFVFFPSCITNSISTLLLPTIAGKQAQGDMKQIQLAIEKSIKYCFILGIFFSGIFFFFGDSLGILLYSNTSVGTYLKILSFLCPFMYITSTLNSILNGLGHTTLCFYQNICSLAIRILFVVFFIPVFGIIGYLWGILVSQLTGMILTLVFLYKKIPYRLDAKKCIILPFFSCLLSCGWGFFLFYQWICRLTFLPSYLQLMLIFLCIGIFYLFMLYLSGSLERSPS